MLPSRRAPKVAVIAILLIYAGLLPILLVQVGTAHPHLDDNGNLIHSVKKHRLDYIDDSKFNYEIKEARLRWNIASTINVSKTKKKNRAELRVNDASGCGVNWIGRYYPGTDRIRFNICAMEWEGGWYEGTDQTLDATPSSRRQRTAVHEFGHALGLDHNNLGDCRSILHSPVDFDQPTCWIPTAHDVEDVSDLWP